MVGESMLLEYRFKNFRSFKEMAEFNMMAPGTKVKKRFPDNYTSLVDGADVLKTAVVVGENAGGKSNFISSLDYLQYLFANGSQSSGTINANNIKGDCPFDMELVQEFILKILAENGQVYLYALKIDAIGVLEETLSIVEKRKKIRIFHVEREFEETCRTEGCRENCGNHYKAQVALKYKIQLPEADHGLKKVMEKSTENTGEGVFALKLAIIGDKHARALVDWVTKRLYAETVPVNYDLYRSMKKEEDDFRIIRDEKYLEIFQMVDYSIVGIKLDEEQPYTDSLVIRVKEDGSYFTKKLKEDSSGVREFFAWAVQIYRVVYEDKVVFADEMDRVLNPVLSDRVISFINGKEHHGQFVFTTHNVMHLDLRTYMKEQIYFVTKGKESLNSELYSLSDFPEVRYETSKIYEFYMKGILGGTAFE